MILYRTAARLGAAVGVFLLAVGEQIWHCHRRKATYVLSKPRKLASRLPKNSVYSAWLTPHTSPSPTQTRKQTCSIYPSANYVRSTYLIHEPPSVQTVRLALCCAAEMPAADDSDSCLTQNCTIPNPSSLPSSLFKILCDRAGGPVDKIPTRRFAGALSQIAFSSCPPTKSKCLRRRYPTVHFRLA